MALGTAGTGVTIIACEEATLEPQVLSAVTPILPADAAKSTVIEVAPVPEVMVAPPGTVHVYPVANGTAEME